MREIPLSAIEDAAQTIYDPVVRTPLVRLDLPASLAGRLPDTRLFVKLETLQPIGSFKIRGAHNVVRQQRREDIRDGVWTVSAGNAAQGVALAARVAGVPCSVLVMDTAPAAKIAAIERLGAAIVRASYDECWRTVETHKSDRMRGFFVHPFDDDQFIAGNGTAGLEIYRDLPDVDVVVASLGGGGLLAGVGAALKSLKPSVKVYAAEPETAAPLDTSLRAGKASYFDGWTASFVDGAGGKSVLQTMWPLLSTLVDGSIIVPLAEVAASMKLLAERLHVIAEGAGAAAVTAALSLARKSAERGGGIGTVVAIVSGGNIDLPRFASLVGACPVNTANGQSS